MDNSMPVYDRIREATGSAATATLHPERGTSTEVTWLVSIVTSNDAQNPLEEARRRLREAAKVGMNGLIAENASYFGRFYDRREAGRIYTDDEQKTSDLVSDVFRSWADKDGKNSKPDPTRFEAGLSNYLEQDWAPWHGLPCYNALSGTSAHVQNRGDRMDYYYQLVPCGCRPAAPMRGKYSACPEP